MPIYEYKCEKCLHQFEEVQHIKEPPLLFCSQCMGPVSRKFFDWDEKMDDFRKYYNKIADAPIMPYITAGFLIVLLFCAFMGGVVYQSLTGFMGVLLYTLAISVIAMLGALPIVGPFIYFFWFGPLLYDMLTIHFELPPSSLSSVIYWTGFAFSVIFSIFTTLFSFYQIKTPILWSFMEPWAQERLKYLLLTRLLNYEVSHFSLVPGTMRFYLFTRILGIRETPTIRLLGKVYKYSDIPVGPIRAIEERRRKILVDIYENARKKSETDNNNERLIE